MPDTPTKPPIRWPLMRNNIAREDLDAVIAHLQTPDPILTNGPRVRQFEEEWSAWLGVKYSVMVNSGSSANLLTLAALREMRGEIHGEDGEIILPPLTWVSDVAAVLQNGFTPVFVDIDPRTLGMDCQQTIAAITQRTRAIFVTHILGYNALTQELIDEAARRNIPLIEDVCESHGATFNGKKLGSLSWASNFSFYYAHHLSTIEGGMICTNDEQVYQTCRMLRAHGMVRESSDMAVRDQYHREYPDLNPNFIFAFPAYNMRPSEINGIFGTSQLRRLDANNEIRRRNLRIFLRDLDPAKFFTDFAEEGSCNYAFTLVLKKPDDAFCARVTALLDREGIEYRRGTSGGGNQLRQPYLRKLFGEKYRDFPNVEHVHFYGFYIGNYPDLDSAPVADLCRKLNAL